ncbi:kinetochore Sim4 complex subunit Fta4 [Neurospora tetraspora]|uniref:Kinetochore Sim4 complex subunit Fta4 n=1 Tax=Neurospora tetraspora TaxID=94610 RepID=A0AAE0MVH1_9PEZI|nr:kinetochore Sim4 complex subunit Fta4 [Neurospora tetraspora]
MPQPPPPPTILSLKSDFLTTQTRTLSQPLAPTRTFLSQNDNTSSPRGHSQSQHHQGQHIPQKPLSEALTKLNHRLTQHNRRAYPPQATRHVAEQIDKLYFSTTSATSLGRNDERDEEDEDGDGQQAAWLRVNADLTLPRLITSLPDSWSPSVSKKEADDHPMEAKRFAELVAQLKGLDEQKQKVLDRVAKLRKIRGLVEGFVEASPSSQDLNAEGGEEVGKGGAGAGGGAGGMKAVQENLVTKNGEMEAELQRMRVLLARVGGRVEKLDKERGKEKERGSGSGRRKRAREGEDGEGAGDERKKVDKLLDSF